MYHKLGKPLSRYRKLGQPVIKRGDAGGIVLSFFDQYPINEGAPLTTPRTTDPGGQIANITDGNNVLSIAGQQLHIGAGAAGALNPRYISEDLVYSVGLACMIDCVRTSGGRHHVGFAEDAGVAAADYPYLAWRLDINNLKLAFFNSVLESSGYGTNTVRVAVILLENYSLFFIKTLNAVGGLDFTEWTRLFVGNFSIPADIYLAIATLALDVVADFDNSKAAVLPDPYNLDANVYRSLSVTPSASDAFTHEADGHIVFVITTLPAAGEIEIRFRIQDATNYWALTIESDGTFDLDEVVAGVPTERGTDAVAQGSVYYIKMRDNTIRTYDDGNGGINYLAANNFKTETNGVIQSLGVGGVISDFSVWDMTPSAAELTQLNAMEAAT